MRRTKVSVDMAVYDTTAPADGALQATGVNPFSDVAALPFSGQGGARYSTLEPDSFLLDGSSAAFPDSPAKMGLWSTSMSDANGNFAVPPVLQIAFSKPHTSMGLTLTFSPPYNEWAKAVKITWKDTAGNDSAVGTFYPDKPVYFVAKKVENYGHLKLEFLGTSLPYRYLKLQQIEYGTTLLFEGDSVMEAVVTEECDLLSAQLHYNTLELKLGLIENTKEVSGNPLLSPALAAAAAERMLSYYLYRHELNAEILMEREHLADMTVVESFNGEKVRGLIEFLRIDLAGGYLGEMRVVGQRIETLNTPYADAEIFAGERSDI